MTDLKWWINNLETNNGRPIDMGLPQMVIESDASNTCWGACWNNRPLVISGMSTPYQWEGAVSRFPSPANLCWEQEWNQCSLKAGQHDRSLLLKSDRQYPFQKADGSDIPDSGVLRSGSSNAYILRTYAEVNGKNEIIYGGVANG